MVFGIWLCNLYYISYYTQQGIWTINHHVWPKYEFIIHNNFLPVKKSLSCCPLILKSQHICFEWFWTVFFFLVNGARFVHNSLLVQLASTFSLERVIFGMEWKSMGHELAFIGGLSLEGLSIDSDSWKMCHNDITSVSGLTVQ